MNLIEFGIVVINAQKANWEDHDFQTFVWHMSQLVDAKIDEIDLENHYPEEKWRHKNEKED